SPEIAQALAHGSGHLGQSLRPQDQEGHHQDDQDFTEREAEHGGAVYTMGSRRPFPTAWARSLTPHGPLGQRVSGARDHAGRGLDCRTERRASSSNGNDGNAALYGRTLSLARDALLPPGEPEAAPE